jgi:hypothetical protein
MLYYCQLSIRAEELTQHMILGASSNCFALVDSGANINIGTTALSRILNLPIQSLTKAVSINTAASGGIMEAIGVIDVGGYLGHMLIVPRASQCLISTDVLTKRGLTVILSTVTCILQTSKKEQIILRKQPNGLFYLNITKFVKSIFNQSYSPPVLVHHDISPQVYWDTQWTASTLIESEKLRLFGNARMRW